MDAYELLKVIQLAGNNVRSNESDLQERILMFNNTEYSFIIEKTRQSNNSMPTDYQDSHFYDLIKNSFAILNETIKTEEIIFDGKKIQPRPLPLYGTVDFDSFNAFITADNSDPVIVLNNGLLKFTQKIIELITKEHYLRSKNLFSKKYQGIFTKNFIDAMMCYYIYGDVYGAISLDLCDIENFDDLKDSEKVGDHIGASEMLYDEAYFQFLFDVEDATYLWIAAHEYAHLLLGHIDNANLSSKRLNEVHVSMIDFDWQEEYDADSLGAILTMQSSACHNSIHGIYLALTCLLFCTCHNEKTSISHPPVAERINNVFAILKKNNYDIDGYRNIDNYLVPKFRKYGEFLPILAESGIGISSAFELQKYLYRECKLQI
jgi:hypothetical protein